MRAVFDTSALVPCLTRHALSNSAVTMLSRFEPFILNFVQAEFANALRTMVRAKIYPANDTHKILDALLSQFRFEAHDPYLPEALRLAIKQDHSVYECLFVAAARANGIPLVTADKRLARKFAAVLTEPIFDLNGLPDPLP